MSPKNPENFSTIAWMRFEIFCDLYVIPIQVYGRVQKHYIGVL